MERLIDDILLVIIKKFTSSSIRNLFRFKATFVRPWRLSNNNKVLRTLPGRCLLHLSDCQPCAEKRAFMQQLSRSGHATCSIALTSQLFQQRNPDLKEIKEILHEAVVHGSGGARYFLMTLNALTSVHVKYKQ